MHDTLIAYWPALLALSILGGCAIWFGWLCERAPLVDVAVDPELVDRFDTIVREHTEQLAAAQQVAQSDAEAEAQHVPASSDVDQVAWALHESCPPDQREQDWRTCFMVDCHIDDAKNVAPLLAQARQRRNAQ